MKINDVIKHIHPETIHALYHWLIICNGDLKESKYYKEIWVQVFGDSGKSQEAWKIAFLDLAIMRLVSDIQILVMEEEHFKNGECYGF